MRFAFICCCAVVTTASAQDYHFSAAGDDGNSGSQASPFRTISKLDSLPDCNTSPAGKEFIGYQKVVAVRLNDYQETTTGQVTCAYMKRQ